VYDALVSERPYKKPFTHEQAVEIIEKDSGTYFDAKIIEAFLNIADDFWVELVSSQKR
jgi:putative two-component system response regulator